MHDAAASRVRDQYRLQLHGVEDAHGAIRLASPAHPPACTRPAAVTRLARLSVIGLAFLVPGLVSPDLPIAFARPAAYGDLMTAVLAWLALALLPSRLGCVLVWVFTCCGSADLLYAFYQGNRTGLGHAPGLMGAAYFIPTILVPLLLITHGLVFRLLLTRDGAGTGRTQPV